MALSLSGILDQLIRNLTFERGITIRLVSGVALQLIGSESRVAIKEQVSYPAPVFGMSLRVFV